ncbi:MAG: HAMP domain-containing sensor histidine kinase [Candidatus Cloacimonadota bacterium]|nr:HAMP domain-containing sensor histidine kinase [Candidatus Cloacimonadota bacterium]
MVEIDKNSIIIHQYLNGVVGKLITELTLKWRQKLDAVGSMIQNFEDAFIDNELSLDYIREKTNRCFSVLKNISRNVDDFNYLLYSNKQTNHFDVEEIIERCITIMKIITSEQGIEISYKCEDTYFLEGEANQFGLVLLSLILNSKESIEEAKSQAGYIKINCHKGKDKFTVSVIDNGKGIPYTIELEDNLFNPFITTKDSEKHSGMGLYVSKMIIEDNFKGKFHYRNTKEGAEFRFEV